MSHETYKFRTWATFDEMKKDLEAQLCQKIPEKRESALASTVDFDIPSPYAGLYNPDNRKCYMSSIFQLLVRLPNFISAVQGILTVCPSPPSLSSILSPLQNLSAGLINGLLKLLTSFSLL